MDIQIAFAAQLSGHLRTLRRARGITQTQLGRHFGLSQARIADIEANPGVVSTEQILNILQFLGADLVVRVASTGTPASGARPVSTAPADRGRASSIPELFGEEATFGRGAW